MLVPRLKNHHIVTLVTLSSLFTFVNQPALGQEEGWVLEEVLVTAQKRVESLQKASLSLTALTSTTIDELGIVDVADGTSNVQAPDHSVGWGLRYVAGDIGIGITHYADPRTYGLSLRYEYR